VPVQAGEQIHAGVVRDGREIAGLELARAGRRHDFDVPQAGIRAADLDQHEEAVADHPHGRIEHGGVEVHRARPRRRGQFGLQAEGRHVAHVTAQHQRKGLRPSSTMTWKTLLRGERPGDMNFSRLSS